MNRVREREKFNYYGASFYYSDPYDISLNCNYSLEGLGRLSFVYYRGSIKFNNILIVSSVAQT